MSYREIRNFTEIMRALSYPRLISMENFRKPNFELVADILYWMVKLYDPDTTISDRVEFENERVDFLTGIANLMATKARLKLNTKKLYASDGRAVQELLKLATMLYSSKKSATAPGLLITENPPPQIKVSDVKAARHLATEITLCGARVYDLLANEDTERFERMRAIQFLDKASSSAEGSREQTFIERSIREIIDTSKQSIEDMRKECEELEADERNIEMKIIKKQEELERSEKRYKSMENVRPQFMDEVEKLEKELQKYYDIYMEKYRNLDYLEHESEKYRKREEERIEEQEKRLKKTRERLLKEEVELLRGGRGDRDDDMGAPVVTRPGLAQSQSLMRASGRGHSRRSPGSQMKRSQDDDESSEGEGEEEDNLTDSVGNDSGDEDHADAVMPSRRPPFIQDPRGGRDRKEGVRGALGDRDRDRGVGRGRGGGRSQDSMRGRGGGRNVERKTSSDADSYSNEDDGNRNHDRNNDIGADGDDSDGSDDAF